LIPSPGDRYAFESSGNYIIVRNKLLITSSSLTKVDNDESNSSETHKETSESAEVDGRG